MSFEPRNVLAQAEDLYENNTSVKALSWAAIVGVGAVVGGKGLAKALREAPEVAYAAGTKEFAAIERAAGPGAVIPKDVALKHKIGFGDPEIWMQPNRGKSASFWTATIPDTVDFTKITPHPHGKANIVEMSDGDINVRMDFRTFAISSPEKGSLIINTANSTAERFAPNGQRLMRLDQHGNEWHYGERGQTVGVVRGSRRTIDFMNIFTANT